MRTRDFFVLSLGIEQVKKQEEKDAAEARAQQAQNR